MSELNKKKSYTIDMKESTKLELAKLAKQLRLPQGDTITFLMDEFGRTQDKLIMASNNEALLSTIISQQNSLVKTIQEQNALIQRLSMEVTSHG